MTRVIIRVRFYTTFMYDTTTIYTYGRYTLLGHGYLSIFVLYFLV